MGKQQRFYESQLKQLDVGQIRVSLRVLEANEQEKEFKAIALEIIGSAKGKLPKKRIELTTVEEVANFSITHYSFEERYQLSNLLLAADNIKNFPQPKLAAA